MSTYSDIGIQIGEILLPRPGIDLSKWAVIACDQFTSQPEYWQKARNLVGAAPSTLHLILPEVYLGTSEEPAQVQRAQESMQDYLSQGVLTPCEGLIYVEREVGGKTRRGLMLALDLERYDYSKTSQSLIRATEGTIVDRLPPRMRIRQGAALELPHILVLIDDPERTVIEPIAAQKETLSKLYDTDLMLGSGRLTGYHVRNAQTEAQVVSALRRLAEPQRFQQKYSVGPDKGVLLFAMGDGNHSLATAKAIWENIKSHVGPDHPARYALVEIENVHDEGLDFEPIHRVLFGVKADLTQALNDYFPGQVRVEPANDIHAMIRTVDNQPLGQHAVGLVSPERAAVVSINQPSSNLPVGTMQRFFDDWGKQGGFDHIDYVHGDEVVAQLGAQPGNLGFYLPAMRKSDLFKTVILDGALPRKTFSMGEAHEKRFYMECRRITRA